MSASATRNTYAGPDPVSPVTASSCASLTRTTRPTPANTPSAQSRSAGWRGTAGEGRDAFAHESRRVRHRAQHRHPSPTAAWSDAIVTPAAIDSTLVAPAAAASAATATASYGLTAITTERHGGT